MEGVIKVHVLEADPGPLDPNLKNGEVITISLVFCNDNHEELNQSFPLARRELITGITITWLRLTLFEFGRSQLSPEKSPFWSSPGLQIELQLWIHFVQSASSRYETLRKALQPRFSLITFFCLLMG